MGEVVNIAPQSEELVRTADVARHLKVSVSTVHKLVKSEGLPCIRLTNVTQRCVRYRMSQVNAWLAGRESRTA